MGVTMRMMGEEQWSWAESLKQWKDIEHPILDNLERFDIGDLHFDHPFRAELGLNLWRRRE